MKFQIEDLNPGTWFDIPGDSDKARICLRVCNFQKLQEIRSATVKETREVVFHPGTHVAQKLVTEYRDQALWDRLYIDYIIVDWDGFKDSKTGDPIPCSIETKMKLWNGSVSFASFVNKCLGTLNELAVQQEEDERKNLQTT